MESFWQESFIDYYYWVLIMDPLRANGPEELAFLGMWYTILYTIFILSSTWVGFMTGYWYIALFLFSLVFSSFVVVVFLFLGEDGDRREEKFLSILERKKRVDVILMFLPLTSCSPPLPSPRHFIWCRTSCPFSMWELPERLSKDLLTVLPQTESQYQKLQGPWGKGTHLHSFSQ